VLAGLETVHYDRDRAWLAQESTGCERREGSAAEDGGCMQEGACGRRAVAPVKIDPPHSFPTFSPREVCAREDEARRGAGGEGGGREGGWRGRGRRRHGVAAQGVLVGGYLPLRLSLCIHISGSSCVCVYLCACVHACMHACMHAYVRTRAHVRPRADEGGDGGESSEDGKRAWIHVDGYATRPCVGAIERIFRGCSWGTARVKREP